MARPKVVWGKKELEAFEELCRIQCTQIEICRVMGVTDKTLTRLCKEHYGQSYSEVYESNRDFGRANLRRSQFKLAKKSAAMSIWLGKQYLDQKDKQEVKNDTTISFSFDGDPNYAE